MLARQVVNAASLGVPLAEWLAYRLPLRDEIIREHNARVKGK